MKNKKTIIILLIAIFVIILLCITLFVCSQIKFDKHGHRILNMKIYEINQAIKKNDISEVEKLIKNTDINKLPLVSLTIEEARNPNYEDDVYPNEEYYDNKSPLQEACYVGNYNIVKLLINNGADVNYQDKTYKETPLMYAIANYSYDINDNTYKIVELLINNGADINIKNHNNETVLDYAKNDEKLVKLLEQLISHLG